MTFSDAWWDHLSGVNRCCRRSRFLAALSMADSPPSLISQAIHVPSSRSITASISKESQSRFRRKANHGFEGSSTKSDKIQRPYLHPLARSCGDRASGDRWPDPWPTLPAGIVDVVYLLARGLFGYALTCLGGPVPNRPCVRLGPLAGTFRSVHKPFLYSRGRLERF